MADEKLDEVEADLEYVLDYFHDGHDASARAQINRTIEKVRRLRSRLEAVEKVVEAAREYTKERTYQNVQACREDQDRLEKVLLDALAALDGGEK